MKKLIAMTAALMLVAAVSFAQVPEPSPQQGMPPQPNQVNPPLQNPQPNTSPQQDQMIPTPQQQDQPQNTLPQQNQQNTLPQNNQTFPQKNEQFGTFPERNRDTIPAPSDTSGKDSMPPAGDTTSAYQSSYR